MTAVEDRHARFLTANRPRLDQLAPLHVSEHGRGFWAVLDPPRDGADSRVGFMPEGPGLAALENPELAETVAELLARYDPAYQPPPDLPGPFDPARNHLVVIFEDGAAYLYRLDGHPNQSRPLLVVVPGGVGKRAGAWADPDRGVSRTSPAASAGPTSVARALRRVEGAA